GKQGRDDRACNHRSEELDKGPLIHGYRSIDVGHRNSLFFGFENPGNCTPVLSFRRSRIRWSSLNALRGWLWEAYLTEYRGSESVQVFYFERSRLVLKHRQQPAGKLPHLNGRAGRS